MRFGTRIALAMATLVLVTAVAAGVLSYRSLRKTALPLELGRLDASVSSLAERLVAECRSARATLRSASDAVAIHGMIRAHFAGGADPLDDTPLEVWRAQAGRRLATDLEVNPSFEQFRIINVDGREIVRADRSGPDRSARLRPDEDLQDKGNRRYFVDTMALPAGEVYTSTIDLNEENGVIEVPHMPVLRLATPLDTDDGRRFGILVINLDMRIVFGAVRSMAIPDYSVFVANESGDYLMHPDPAKAFGFQLGEPHRVKDDFPLLVLPAEKGFHEVSLTRDAAGRVFGVAVVNASPLEGRVFHVMAAIPESAMVASAAGIRRSSLFVGLVAVVIAVGIGVWLAYSVARPLTRMTAAVTAFSGDEPSHVPPDGPGEIGVLARAFNRMTTEVRDKTQALRNEIEVRRKAEEAAEANAASARLLSAIVESSSDAIVTNDLDGTITSWNDGAEQVFGFPARNALGKDISIIVPEDQQAKARDTLKRIAQGERIHHYETVRRRQDNRLLDVSLTISPIRDREGRVTGASNIARDVTEAKLAEERFHVAVEAAPSGMVMVNERGKIVLVNAETERLFGYDRDELIGQSIEILLPERFRDGHHSMRTGFARQPKRRPMGKGLDLYGRRKDGTEFRVEIGLNPIKTREGLLILSVIVDITERIQVEEAVREGDRRLKLVMENMTEGLVISDLSGHLIFWNHTALAMHGFKDTEDWNRNLPDFISIFELSTIDGQILPYEQWPIPRILRGDEIRNLEVCVRRTDADWVRVFSYNGAILGDPTHQNVAFLTITDITVRHETESALRQSEARFRQLADSLPQLVWTCRGDGACDFLNRRWEEYTGHPAEDQLGFAWQDKVHPDDAAEVAEKWRQSVAENRELQVEFRIRRHDGVYRWFDTRATPVTDAQGGVIKWFGSNTDVTSRRTAERAAKEYAAELKRSNEELEQFAYVASHDLQEPLRMVASYTELLGDRYRGRLDEKADKFIHYAVDGARRMQRLVDDLLTFSRVGRRGRPFNWVDMNRVVTQACRSIDDQLSATDAKLDQMELPRVWGDEGLLIHVMLNIISNAVKFRREEPPHIRISAETNEDGWTLAVADNGIGIAQEDAGRLFKMFQRLHERGKYDGSGIGLAIARKIVQFHGGSIWFDSKQGHGSTFYFRLPRPGESNSMP